MSVRDTERAVDLAAQGVRVRRGDFTDPATLSEAFESASQVLIVSSNETSMAAVTQNVAAIDAARAAGADRILYTSHQGAAPESLFAPMPDHAATEQHLRETGTAHTSLRNGYYANTVPLLLGQALTTGEIVAPADGPVSWTTHADLAEAAGIILAAPGRFEGPTPPLTAAEALDLNDIAGLLSELTGRTIRRTVVEDDDFAAGLLARGVPEGRANMLLGMLLASRRGEFATTGHTLEELLGRPATSLRSCLGDLVAAR